MWKRFDPARPLAVIVGAVVAGLLAGLVASVLLTFTAEPLIDQAIALEESHHAAEAHDPNEAAEPELVSRSRQKGAGRFAAYGLGGAAYGVLFGVTFLVLRRRPAAAGPGGRSAPRPRRRGPPGRGVHGHAVRQVPAQPAGRRRPNTIPNGSGSIWR